MKIDQTDYQMAINDFPDSLVSHFPKELVTNNYGLTQSYESDYSHTGLYLKIPLNDAVDSIIKNNDLIKYHSNDPCLFVVNRYYRFNNHGIRNDYNSELDIAENCSKEMLPIPNFRSIGEFRKKENYGLSTGYLIYVVDAKPEHSNKNIKSNWRRWMPEKWVQGYSKGFAINQEEKDLIFWTIKW